MTADQWLKNIAAYDRKGIPHATIANTLDVTFFFVPTGSV